jgi:hypothetical protein
MMRDRKINDHVSSVILEDKKKSLTIIIIISYVNIQDRRQLGFEIPD